MRFFILYNRNINLKILAKKKKLYLNEFPYFVHQSAENGEANVDLKESLKKAKKEDDNAQSKEVFMRHFIFSQDFFLILISLFLTLEKLSLVLK